MDEIYDSFNSQLRDLSDKLCKIVKEDNEKIIKVDTILNIAIKNTPTLPIEEAHELIWNMTPVVFQLYNDETETYNWDILLNTDYKSKLNNKTAKELEKQSKSDIKDYTKFIKSAFLSCTEEEKQDLYDDVVSIISTVVEYREAKGLSTDL